MAFKEGVILGPISFNATGTANTTIGAISNTGTISIGNSLSGAIVVDCGGAGLSLGATAISHTTTLGSLTGASQTFIQAGAGLARLQLTTNDGGIIINSGTGGIAISNDATNNQIFIGTGAGVKDLVIGSSTSTSLTTLQCGSSHMAIQTNNGSMALTSGTGDLAISDDAFNTLVRLGTGAGVKNTMVGSTNTTSVTTIQSGSSGISIATSSNGTIGITSGTGTISIGTDAAAKTISIGNSTGATAVQISAGTGASSFQPTGAGSLALGSTNTGTTTLGNLTGTTTINFGGGSALSTYNDWNTFTPTAIGRTSAGSTTYVTQAGFYMRIGNVVITQFTIIYSAATGTGDILIGGLPFTINGTANYQPTGSCIIGGAGVTWPAGLTSLVIQGLGASTTAVITASGTAAAQANIQIANTTTTIIGTLMYRI